MCGADKDFPTRFRKENMKKYNLFLLLVLSIFSTSDLQAQSSPDEAKLEPNKRKLASGSSPAEDLQHYLNLQRRLGVNLGMMVPMGDFQSSFSPAAMVGLHFTWEAMAPFSLRVSTNRSSSYHKDGAASGKLTVSQINIGTQASFSVGRMMPFVKFEGSFNFNDVAFDSTKVVEAGSDTFVTTVGLNIGVGFDFIIGREMSFGFDGTYHYLVPKKVSLSDNSMFDLGSGYATIGFRVNF